MGKRTLNSSSTITTTLVSWVVADDDYFIIRNLPLFLTNTTRAWLEHLLPRCIYN
jgi:hypothetical protein